MNIDKVHLNYQYRWENVESWHQRHLIKMFDMNSIFNAIWILYLIVILPLTLPITCTTDHQQILKLWTNWNRYLQFFNIYQIKTKKIHYRAMKISLPMKCCPTTKILFINHFQDFTLNNFATVRFLTLESCSYISKYFSEILIIVINRFYLNKMWNVIDDGLLSQISAQFRRRIPSVTIRTCSQ
jgi:hypothetical protein